jgi:aspartyl-tRNA(Asn)/glutamyl-tRNA(Gln) amidotransferase subunit B
LKELKAILQFCEISEANMEEGNLRCDANISIRHRNSTELGTRVEIKNLNSFKNVQKALDYELERQIEVLSSGKTIDQETRLFDADLNQTLSMRTKEEAEDYRYFPDPDLTPFHLKDDYIESIRLSIPALQEERVAKYTSAWHLSEYDAHVLTDEKETADYFEEIIKYSSSYKAAANWMLGPVRSWLNENNKGIHEFPLGPEKMADLVHLVDTGKLSFTVASGKLFSYLLANPSKDPQQIAIEQNLIQQSDVSSLEPLIDEILNKHAEKVKEYKKGKKGLLSLFVGEVMKRSKGKADPRVTNEILLEKLKS